MKIELDGVTFVSTDIGIEVMQDDIVLFKTTPEQLSDIAKMMRKEKSYTNALNNM